MRLTYNVVINSYVDKVWNLLSNLDRQESLLEGLTVEKESDNSYVFHFDKNYKTLSYHVVLLEKEENKKLSFCMNLNNIKIINTYFFSSNGIETYIKYHMDVKSDSLFTKIIKYPLLFLSFRKRVDSYFKLLQKQC